MNNLFDVEICIHGKWLLFSDKPLRYEDARIMAEKIEQNHSNVKARWIKRG